MLRRSRTREPTWMSIGFGTSPFRRPGRRVCCCIAIFGRSPLRRELTKVTEYTIVRDEQPTRYERNRSEPGLVPTARRERRTTLSGDETRQEANRAKAGQEGSSRRRASIVCALRGPEAQHRHSRLCRD